MNERRWDIKNRIPRAAVCSSRRAAREEFLSSASAAAELGNSSGAAGITRARAVSFINTRAAACAGPRAAMLMRLCRRGDFGLGEPGARMALIFFFMDFAKCRFLAFVVCAL